MSDAEAPGPSEEPLPQGTRHPLGIGSKFSVSADGRLQGPSRVSLAQASEGWTEASGAVQGVSPLLSTTEGRTASDSISDALMLSRGIREKRTKLYSISDEADLASGRGDYVQAPPDSPAVEGQPLMGITPFGTPLKESEEEAPAGAPQPASPAAAAAPLGARTPPGRGTPASARHVQMLPAPATESAIRTTKSGPLDYLRQEAEQVANQVGYPHRAARGALELGRKQRVREHERDDHNRVEDCETTADDAGTPDPQGALRTQAHGCVLRHLQP